MPARLGHEGVRDGLYRNSICRKRHIVLIAGHSQIEFCRRIDWRAVEHQLKRFEAHIATVELCRRLPVINRNLAEIKAADVDPEKELAEGQRDRRGFRTGWGGPSWRGWLG